MGVKLIDNKAKVVAALKQQVANGLNAAGGLFVSEAQKNANVDTGFMFTHIGVTKAASPEDLSVIVRSLAPYSMYQNTGIHGNLFWTRAYLVTREKFKEFIYKGRAYAGGAGVGVIRSALHEFQHLVTDHGFRVTKIKAFGGGRVIRGKLGRFVGRYGGKG